MAERERRQTPPFGGVFVSHARIMTADDMGRAIRRMAHEVIERNHGLSEVVVIGLQTGGVPVAVRLVETLEEIEGIRPPLGTLDVALHRDDIGLRPVVPEAATELPTDLDSRIVVLVDDVLFTGRTIRAALDAILAGEPAAEHQVPSIGCNIKWKEGAEPQYFNAAGIDG